MASTKLDPAVAAHQEWIGFVGQTGLVVSASALVRAGAILDRRDIEGQRLLAGCVEERAFDPDQGPIPHLPDFRTFAESVLGWTFSSKGCAGTPENPIPPELELPLPDYGETLRPDLAVREPDPTEDESAWQLLVQILEPGEDFDRVVGGGGGLESSAHGRMERLLRHARVPAGVLFNGTSLRLVSAPRGESSGWIDFKVADMIQTAGRPISTALRLLLGQSRLLSLPRVQRLSALLEDSRKFQNEVSERLAQQVLHALYELLRGFQSAHDNSKGTLLREPLGEDPDEIYRGLLTVILRLVFLLYSEERDMFPKDETFQRFYSLAGLHERLREDTALFPDTMDQRFGAWAQLLVLFRMINDGLEVDDVRIPERHGVLFDPDRFPFLEGRPAAGARQTLDRLEPPLVPDGTIYRALEKLLVLEGERISYRALDVEQIGSVYETMMGFRLETASGRSVAIKAQKKHGAPTAVDIEALLEQPSAKREKWVRDRAERKLSDTVKKATLTATTVEDMHAALVPVIDPAATPDLVPKGAMVLQPSEERRRSGSHYTPRSLTEPIVRTTLEPILNQLRGTDGRVPEPAQILELKICDPAMGSGAFLVEACRQLGDRLVEAWHSHGEMPVIPSDEDEVIYARRLIAQRCLYGVDRNPVAVDLAKMSLWLVTLAKEHALSFVDHALRHGDSLVGLSRKQIETFHWDSSAATSRRGFETIRVGEHLAKIRELRQRIRESDDTVTDRDLRGMWEAAEFELGKVRFFGDLVIASYFEADNPKGRESKRDEYARAVSSGSADIYRGVIEEWRHSDRPISPFHWDVEFPEVFDREKPGFQAIVGNPPFAGKNSVASANPLGYLDWLKTLHEGTHGNADLVAHFFRRAFNLLSTNGAWGLIATNTIGQGDTRSTGLAWICKHGGDLYHARKRVRWPGLAAVVVSVVHGMKGSHTGERWLDHKRVDTITAYLFHRGGHDDPAVLAANAGKSFQGSIVLGMGFTFDDEDTKGLATPLAEMRRLIQNNPKNQEVIFPYIGGDDVNSKPTLEHHRYVIDFYDRTEVQSRKGWPDLMSIVERNVRPERERQKRKALRERWWQFAEKRPGLKAATAKMDMVLGCTLHSKHLSFAFLPARAVFSHALAVFPLSTLAAFCALQSRPHEIWARFFGSTLGDHLRYTPTDCFETFPFPPGWEDQPLFDAAGAAYYETRAAAMIAGGEGLTQIYNRFHQPAERDPEILELRRLHDAMDRVVLDSFGWVDIPTACNFFLDFESEPEESGAKMPWRYRWPDEVRDETLARLLELNAERAREEARSKPGTKGKRAQKSTRRVTRRSDAGTLFS